MNPKYLLFLLIFSLACANNSEVKEDQDLGTKQDTSQDTAANTYQQNYEIVNVAEGNSTPNDTSEGVTITGPDGTTTTVAKTNGAVNIQMFSAPSASGSVAPSVAGELGTTGTQTGTASATQDIQATLQLLLQYQQALQASANTTPNQGPGSATSTNSTDQKLDKLIELLQNQAVPNKTETTTSNSTDN